MFFRLNTSPLRFVSPLTLPVFGLLIAAQLLSKPVFAQIAPAPTHLTAASSTSSVIITWDDTPLGPPPPGGSRFTGYYNVYRTITKGTVGTIPYARAGHRSDNGAGRVSFTDTHVSPGKTYYYQVTSVTVTTVTFPNFPTKIHTYESVRSAEVKGTMKARGKTMPRKKTALNIDNG